MKFNGKNDFFLWQRRMKDILIQKGLHKPLEGKAKKPEKMSEEDWKELDQKAASAIRINLSDEVVYNVINDETAEAIWKKLESLFDVKSVANKFYLTKQICSLRMEENSIFLEHLSVFIRLISQMVNAGMNLPEENKVVFLLASLPQSYDDLVAALQSGKDTIELTEIAAALITDEKGKEAIGDGNHGRKAEVKCFHCNEEGHMRRDCRILKEEILPL